MEEVVGSVVALVVIIGLKLWALYWLYTFTVAWVTTGVTPAFWTFVWAAVLVIFLTPTGGNSSKK